MKKTTASYQVPEKNRRKSRPHSNLLGGLEEGGERIPFWDDVNLTELSEISKNAMLIEVIENPLRFRFGIVGRTVAERYGTEIDGRFLGEMDEWEKGTSIMLLQREMLEDRDGGFTLLT